MSLWSILNSEKAKLYKTIKDFTVIVLLGDIMFLHMIVYFLVRLPLDYSVFFFPKGARLGAFLIDENVA